MLRRTRLALALLATLTLAHTALASAYQTVDISTGINVGLPGNPPYPSPGGRDDYWRVRSVPGTSYLPTPVQGWTVSMGTGWNTIPGVVPIFGNNTQVGTSEYERCFCLQSPEKAQLSLVMRADNKANLFLNSYFANPIVQALVNNTFASNVAPMQYTYTQQTGLKAGLNCIRVRVNNEGGPTGLALKATVQGFGAQDAAPEGGCCRQGGPVFSEALRQRQGIELDPQPDAGAPRPEAVSPGRPVELRRPD
ncbi:MAG TPA: hypothetical protein VGX48_15920 [Pyrinomonadaceae bacterium]|jgi:hypothetical protein|nr:hypothetical protein [Pyrinomonadaceae bacterium]